jgi:hypothetical protein
MPGSNPISDELKEFVELLISHKVEFIVAGSHALAFHGIPRFTEDIDFFIRRTEANVRRLQDALAEAEIKLDEAGLEKFVTSDRQMIVVGNEPNRVDFLNFLSGLSFDEAWENRVEGTIQTLPVYFLSKADYIKTKRAAGRPKDLADLALLEGSDR